MVALPDNKLDTSTLVEILMVSKGCTIIDPVAFQERSKTHRIFQQWPETGLAESKDFQELVPFEVFAMNERAMEGKVPMVTPVVIEEPR